MSIFFLIIIFLFLSYLGLIIWSFWNRKNLRGILLLVIPILLFGILLLISNWTFIGLKKDIYSKKYKTEKEYKAIYGFLKEVDSKALQSSTNNLITAFKNFFQGLKESRKVGHPRLKSRKNKQSYTTYNINNNIRINFESKLLKLPKLKSWIRFQDSRIFNEPFIILL